MVDQENTTPTSARIPYSLSSNRGIKQTGEVVGREGDDIKFKTQTLSGKTVIVNVGKRYVTYTDPGSKGYREIQQSLAKKQQETTVRITAEQIKREREQEIKTARRETRYVGNEAVDVAVTKSRGTVILGTRKVPEGGYSSTFTPIASSPSGNILLDTRSGSVFTPVASGIDGNIVYSTTPNITPKSPPRGTYEATPPLESGILGTEKFYAESYQSYREAQYVQDINRDPAKVPANYFNVVKSGGVLIAARTGQNIVNLPSGIYGFITDPIGSTTSIPGSLKQSFDQDPLIALTDVGFMYFGGKALGKIGGRVVSKFKTETTGVSTVGGSEITYIKINPKITQTATITKATSQGGIKGVSEYVTGTGKIITDINGKKIKSNAAFEMTVRQVGKGESRAVSRGLLETGKITDAFTVSQTGFKQGALKSTVISEAQLYKIRQTQPTLRYSPMAKSVGGFKVTKLADVSIDGFRKTSYDVRGVTAVKGIKKTKISTGIESGGVEFNRAVMRDATRMLGTGRLQGKLQGVNTKSTLPEIQTTLETLKPLAKTQALRTVKTTQPVVKIPGYFDSPVKTVTPLKSTGVPAFIPSITKPQTGRISTGMSIKPNISYSTSIKSSVGQYVSPKGRPKQDIIAVPKVSTKPSTSTRPDVRLNVIPSITQTTGSQYRQRTLPALKITPALRPRVVPNPTTTPLPLIPFSPGIPYPGISQSSPKTRRRRKDDDYFSLDTAFTPSLFAVGFNITGRVKKGKIYTGTEIRPLPKKRKK